MRLLVLLLLFSVASCGQQEGFRLFDEESEQEIILQSLQADSFLQNSVIVAYDAECPVCILYKTSLDYLSKTYPNVSFKIILTKDAEIEEAKERFYDDHTFRIYQDSDNRFLKKIGATTTPHAFVFDQNGKEIYSGKIDDRVKALGNKKEFPDSLYLSDALRALQSNQLPKIRKTQPVGCLIQ